ncbi:MAG: hypothetical protein HQM13_02380 [SAR324 cluster bacterium]|nr:hypothetical protein [SAR324 cluster bacterium]
MNPRDKVIPAVAFGTFPPAGNSSADGVLMANGGMLLSIARKSSLKSSVLYHRQSAE